MLKSELINLINEILSEENILIPRRLDSRHGIYVKKIETLLQQKFIDGNLDIDELPEITDLGNLEKISGNLILKDSNITSLGNLKTVRGILDLRNTKIKNLGKLENVGASIILLDSEIHSLGNTKIGDKIFILSGQFSDELLEKYKKQFPRQIAMFDKKTITWIDLY